MFKAVWLIVTCCFLFPSTLLALEGKYYVVPKAELPIRSGKGTNYKILAIVKEGTSVEVLREDGPWANVRLADGKEGWILSRYLSSEEPPRKQVKMLRDQLSLLKNELSSTQTRLAKLREQLKACEAEKEGCLAKQSDITNKYNLLLTDSKNVTTLKAKYEKQLLEIDRLKNELTILRRENSQLKNDQNVKWFLAGSGVLILGWIVGYLLGRRRKRRFSTLL
ncbi:TIGR04211 family SH3 domain-containing protein [Dissulfuribacter thermophilus]|nr:TIGR04211 family SH3 domain-containing protein [Dissulfuribacter thermophilus]